VQSVAAPRPKYWPYVPARQGEGTLVPIGQNLPYGHIVGTDVARLEHTYLRVQSIQSAREAPPEVALNLPAGQGTY